jgi:endogenous inhibitor of DNA gyrase (YacG/DUF329 family)
MSGPSEPRCPVCGKGLAQTKVAPFCSTRCADIDLGRWLKGGYAIPGSPADEATDSVPGGGQAPEDE